ncbi:hypothetical protein FACS1894199_11280 [Bacteroidia bacterium]|nr:hypothetical protein FACS1894199_11280 [Bacteroidia bacterium]
MMLRFCTICLLLVTCVVSAQRVDSLRHETRNDIYEELASKDASGGMIFLEEGEYIYDLEKRRIKVNKEHKVFNGYRIQIFSGSSFDYSIDRVTAIKNEFREAFPDISAYLNYFDPDFKIRVGNFKNRLDCIPTLKQLRRKYPGCYPVRTDISFEEINKK